MTEETQSGVSGKELICPRCESLLPSDRFEFRWCECGWNLPSDPIEEWRGWRRLWGRIDRRFGKLQADRDAIWLRREGAQNRLGWYLLTDLVLLLAPLSVLVQQNLRLTKPEIVYPVKVLELIL